MSQLQNALTEFYLAHGLLWFVERETGAFQALTVEQADALPPAVRARYVERLSLAAAIAVSEQIKARKAGQS